MYANFPAMTSIQATSGSSFLSVRGGATSKISEDTIKLSDREHEDLYVNRHSGDSSPEIVYENTEPKVSFIFIFHNIG